MKKGRVQNSSLFLIRSISGAKDIRIAAAAPTKVAKTAAKRIQIRRKIYDTMSPLIDKLTPGTHIIIFAKKDISELENQEITNNILQCITLI